jgi:hypothetical protein
VATEEITHGNHMNKDQMFRLINLIAKTGDRVIVTDPSGENPYVMMSLDQYEKLVGTAEPATGSDPKGSDPSLTQSVPVSEKPAARAVEKPAAQPEKKPLLSQKTDNQHIINAPINIATTAGFSRGFGLSSSPVIAPPTAAPKIRIQPETPVWKPQNKPILEEKRVKEKVVAGFNQIQVPNLVVEEVGLDPEGEEQFFLEPLE